MRHVCALRLTLALVLTLAGFITPYAAGQTCSLAPTSIDTPGSICSRAIGKAFAGGPAGATYAWSITNGTLLGTTTTDTAIFRAASSGTVTLNVTVSTAAGCSTGSQTVTINPLPGYSTVTPPSEPWCASSGGHVASVDGAGPTFEWSIANGTITGGQGTSSITFATGEVSPTVLFLTETNASGCSRTSSVSYARQRDEVSYDGQPFPPDSVGIAPSQTLFPQSGGSGSVSLQTSCSWNATSTAPWLTITSPPSGSGNAIVTFSVAANTLSRSRSAMLTIGGAPLSIVQDGTGLPDGNSMRAATIAGTSSLTVGFANGPASSARFGYVYGTAVDAAGNVFVADRRNYVIRRIDASGQVTTFAGAPGVNGHVDGPAAAARFSGPSDLAIDTAGNLYVSDGDSAGKAWEGHTLRKITPAGVVSTIAGRPGVAGYADGSGSAALFARPEGVDVGPDGNIYVADSLNAVVRRVTPGGVVTTVAGMPNTWDYADGPADTAAFGQLTGLAAAPDGSLYVIDLGAWGGHMIRKIDTSGTVSTLAGDPYSAGTADGTGAAATFSFPWSMAWAGGDLYVGDSAWLRRVTTGGAVTTVGGGGTGDGDGPGLTLRFGSTLGLAAGISSDLTFGDGRGRVRRMSLATSEVTTIAGQAAAVPPPGSGDGTGAAAVVSSGPLAFDPASGNVLLAESTRIRQITPAGAVTTIAGLPGTTSSVDGPVASATFRQITGITVAPSGDVYVSDYAFIRRISGGNVTTIAGRAGVFTAIDGTGSGAAFISPGALTCDPSGVIYVADRLAVRRVTAGGDVTTIAGSATLAGYADGSGPAARFNYARAIAFGPDGALYVGDSDVGSFELNNAIRRVTLAGVVTSLAGKPLTFGSGDGSGADARFTSIASIAFDPSGNLFMTERRAGTIRRMAPDGDVTTVLGMAQQLGSGDGTGAHARLTTPDGITSDASGNIYFVDAGTVRRASLAAASTLAAPAALTATATSTSAVSVTWNAVAGAARYDIYRSSGGSPFTLRGGSGGTSLTDDGLAGQATYLYFVRAVDANGAQSMNSNIDGATTIEFTDDPLSVYLTRVKALHFTELRKAVDAYRIAANLPPLAPDGTIVSGAPARAQHATVLRTALNQARVAAGVGAVTFTSSIVAGTSPVRAVDIRELRNGTK